MKLFLTQLEHDELRNTHISDKNITVLNLLENELGFNIEVNEAKVLIERNIVVGNPTVQRKCFPITPLQFYELSLILEDDSPAVLRQLMHHATGSVDSGFPVYFTPSKSILNAQHSLQAGQPYLFTFSNARPGVSVTYFCLLLR